MNGSKEQTVFEIAAALDAFGPKYSIGERLTEQANILDLVSLVKDPRDIAVWKEVHDRIGSLPDWELRAAAIRAYRRGSRHQIPIKVMMLSARLQGVQTNHDNLEVEEKEIAEAARVLVRVRR